MKKEKLITVAEAASLLGLATTTIYAMLSKGELKAFENGNGPLLVRYSQAKRAPVRKRGRQIVPAELLRGKAFAEAVEMKEPVASIAARNGISRAAVYKDIVKYHEAVIREA